MSAPVQIEAALLAGDHRLSSEDLQRLHHHAALAIERRDAAVTLMAVVSRRSPGHDEPVPRMRPRRACHVQRMLPLQGAELADASPYLACVDGEPGGVHARVLEAGVRGGQHEGYESHVSEPIPRSERGGAREGLRAGP
jgi:hypothetical protein